jgi:hypothetical protein
MQKFVPLVCSPVGARQAINSMFLWIISDLGCFSSQISDFVQNSYHQNLQDILLACRIGSTVFLEAVRQKCD